MLWVEGSIQGYFGSVDPETAAGAVIDIVHAANVGEESD
jgi:hypothetical protein